MNRSPAFPDRQPSSFGSSFHYSFGLLPRRQREAIDAVYAFCRIVDDVADEQPGGRDAAIAELGRYRQEIDRCYAGVPTTPITLRLQQSVREFAIPREPLEEILEGVAMDLHKSRYADFDELRRYCYRVASAVGIVCIHIFECRDPGSRDYAVDLGIALQLTNILRDLKADADRGRLYVPLDEVKAFGLGEAELLAGAHNDRFLALMSHQAERAHRFFSSAARLLPAADRRRLIAAEVMGAIYRRLLRRIEANDFRVFERRFRVPRLTQLSVALRAWVIRRAGA